MALLTNYKVSKQLSRLDITALCHVKMKHEMAWKHDDCQFLVSIQLDEMKYLRACDHVLWQGFYEDDPKISWLLKRTAEHQFTNKNGVVIFTSANRLPCWQRLFTLTPPTNVWLQSITEDYLSITAPVAQMVKYVLKLFLTWSTGVRIRVLPNFFSYLFKSDITSERHVFSIIRKQII